MAFPWAGPYVDTTGRVNQGRQSGQQSPGGVLLPRGSLGSKSNCGGGGGRMSKGFQLRLSSRTAQPRV